MTQDQHQSQTKTPTSLRKTDSGEKSGGRGLQVILISAGLIGLMVLAVGVREYVGGQSGETGSDTGPSAETTAAPSNAVAELDNEIWESQGDSISGKYLASRHAERTGNLSIAADLLLEILELEPQNSRALARAHILLIAEGRFDEATILAETMLAEEGSSSALAEMTLAMQAVKGDDYDAALSHILKIPYQGPYGFLMPLIEAWTFIGMGESEAAIESLDPLASNGALSGLKGVHAGVIADQSGDMTRAEAEYLVALGNGESVPLRVAELYFSFLSRQDRWEEAEAFLATYLEQNRDNLMADPMAQAVETHTAMPLPIPTIHAGYAEAFYSIANRLNSGRADLETLIFVRFARHLDPENPRILFLLGDVLADQDRSTDAIEVLEQVDTQTPFGWYARLSIASRLSEMDREIQAIDMLSNMIDERPERTDAAHTLGDIQRIDENYGEAADAYGIAIERLVDPGERDWQIFYTRGISLERVSVDRELSDREKDDAWSQAERDFLFALELNPDQPQVLNYLGYSWVEKGVHLDQAREMISKSVSQRPRDGYITDSMGWVLYRMGEYEEAVVHLERAVSLVPSDPILNDHLGDAYWLVGRTNEARFQWERALENEPTAKQTEELRAKLSGETEPQPRPPGQEED